MDGELMFLARECSPADESVCVCSGPVSCREVSPATGIILDKAWSPKPMVGQCTTPTCCASNMSISAWHQSQGELTIRVPVKLSAPDAGDGLARGLA